MPSACDALYWLSGGARVVSQLSACTLAQFIANRCKMRSGRKHGREMHMRLGILGTGAVGKTLAARLNGMGHEVMIGTRDADETMSRTDA